MSHEAIAKIKIKTEQLKNKVILDNNKKHDGKSKSTQANIYGFTSSQLFSHWSKKRNVPFVLYTEHKLTISNTRANKQRRLKHCNQIVYDTTQKKHTANYYKGNENQHNIETGKRRTRH
jgi:hypothetical protein